MTSPVSINDVLGSPSKLAILRVLSSREGLKATGREIARLAGYSAPSAHETLKELHALDVLTLEVFGKQHLYALNEANRLVQKIIRPMFQAESGFKNEAGDFLVQEIKKSGIRNTVASLIFYGSAQNNTARPGSDVDIAVITSRAIDRERVADIFISTIAPKFKQYFGVHLDAYVKSAAEFRKLLKSHRPPVSTLMRSYAVLLGKEPLEI